MSKRLTTRDVSNKSDEFARIKSEVIEAYHEDLFTKRGWECSVTLVENMGKDNKVVGFTIPDQRLGGSNRYHHGYSLITHEVILNKSVDVAVKWVKMQAKHWGANKSNK